ncbi:MAG: hypothetical protein UR90_C0007G0004 [Parcubacteria group bacterium GW2011_GWC1_35_8]|uniref:DUF475 domain-containing protein n=2 Tax=Candidatus Nomuraibacteriota TaxID=1752729 RepID=A0A1F6YV67_9BACT|nr:MAG: hypothetical protein UR90_C0007G0004 [Parcubacteria group bacterium GW2011_GWC1_35_8]KKP88540.1 MAG: hypothetical protein UR91_C0016G0003 [Candidatus Nomurabacteria bacterium GW2011_GWC2_35_8]OGJ06312.1 MAG: hypothetical protein A2238_00500 [Candidatus Nomurabacteria bacterium RIFOXYA2_FULL_35_9]OGJ10256.1 MAG: hypothetical protein A2456_03285 [Candidatus Nomurabacteria bacterium RIFOXYC2_FULL_36_19]OGJ14303.1 MAG: hypothetical protein A2554_00840 [Candidatus Nomurabacteria bacterium RI
MIFSALVTIIGLSLFEAVSSVDNAIINAEVLSTMGARARRWFLTWGMFIAVFLVRGLLPFVIVWSFNTSLTPFQILSAAWSNDPLVLDSIEKSAPILLVAGGVFLLFLFLHWLFLEEKHLGLPKTEKFFMSKGVWFYAIVSILLAVICWFALKENSLMGFGAVVGSSLFFITHGFKQNAEEQEKKLLGSTSSDLSKLFFLEIIDTTFSIDGVLGAFAFTLSVPLILIGNGFGALLVRQVTISNIERIKKYVYLKNGAMYSILVLGIIMILHSFGFKIPEYVSPVVTIFIILFFFWKSKLHLENGIK